MKKTDKKFSALLIENPLTYDVSENRMNDIFQSMDTLVSSAFYKGLEQRI